VYHIRQLYQMPPHERGFYRSAFQFLFSHAGQLPEQPPGGEAAITPAEIKQFDTESPVDEFLE
jgi:hypothetical protein